MPSEQIDAVLFDFFDVIHADHQKAWLDIVAKEGHDVDPFMEISKRLDLGRVTMGQYFEGYAAAHSDPNKTAQQVKKEFEELSVVDIGVVRIIEELRGAGIKTGLLTNTSQDSIGPLLERNRLTELFDDIIISGNVGVAKPSPQIYAMMLDRLGIENPSHAFFTDDNQTNIDAASKLGIKAVLFTGADKLRQDLNELGVLQVK